MEPLKWVSLKNMDLAVLSSKSMFGVIQLKESGVVINVDFVLSQFSISELGS